MSNYIGIVINRLNNDLIMVINPDFDEELDCSSWTTSIDEERVLLKIPRHESPLFSKNMNLASVAYIQENIKTFIEKIK